MRNNAFFQHYRDYFPLNLVKTTDLKAHTNYMFAVFPHGILCSSVFGNFISTSPKWTKLFPGIASRVLTLQVHFNIPIWRELLYSWGMAAASANSLTKLLTFKSVNKDGTTSNAAIVVVGGAQEALNARPNNYELVVNKRKGFIKIAIKTGAPVVPVISFGEVDIFEQASNPAGSILRRFQEYIKKLTGIAPAVFIGRGFLQYTFGFVPQRKPITTVVGAPIPVKINNEPSQEEIDDLHRKFVNALKELFENNKSKYLENSQDLELKLD